MTFDRHTEVIAKIDKKMPKTDTLDALDTAMTIFLTTSLDNKS